MAKVSEEDADIIYRASVFELRAMRRLNGELPARQWFDGLTKKGQGQVMAAVQVVETTLLAGRPPGGRAQKVVISTTGLWELKPTKPGGSPPHLRLLYLRRENVLWAAGGFSKQKNKLSSADVRACDEVTKEWIEQGN